MKPGGSLNINSNVLMKQARDIATMSSRYSVNLKWGNHWSLSFAPNPGRVISEKGW
jgi:hypothetical protein